MEKRGFHLLFITLFPHLDIDVGKKIALAAVAEHARPVGGAQTLLAAGNTWRVFGRVDTRGILDKADVGRGEVGADGPVKARIGGAAAQRERKAAAARLARAHTLKAREGAATIAKVGAAKAVVDLTARALKACA